MNIETSHYPTIGQSVAHGNTSDRYQFVPTSRMLTVLADYGWHPSKVMEARTRKSENLGFQKHIVRLRNETQLPVQVGEYVPEIVLINSHMGTCAFSLMAGIFRLVCLNGLVTGDSFACEKVRHTGYADEIAETSVRLITESMPKTIEAVQSFKGIKLLDSERQAFADSAIELIKDPEDKYSIKPSELLRVRRWNDKQDESLWGTLNVVQENVMKGGLRRYDVNGRRNATRAVKNIDRNIGLNRALWSLADKMAELKIALN